MAVVCRHTYTIHVYWAYHYNLHVPYTKVSLHVILVMRLFFYRNTCISLNRNLTPHVHTKVYYQYCITISITSISDYY